MLFERLQDIQVDLCCSQDCIHDGILQRRFFHRRRVMAVFFAVVQSVDAAPDDPLFTTYGPCASTVWRAAFAADQQLRQCVFTAVLALFRSSARLLDLAFGSTTGQFFLHSGEGSCIDDCRMIVLHIVLGPFPSVDL